MSIFPETYKGVFLLRLILPIVILLFAGCAHVSQPIPVSRPPQSKLPPVVNYALSLQGTPYRYGKESPREGFDCSGFVQHVYEHHGIVLPRTAQEMARSLPYVSINELQSGDLIFFNTSGNKYSHVGLYITDTSFIHAPSHRTGKVLISSLNNRYWKSRFTGARRPVLH